LPTIPLSKNSYTDGGYRFRRNKFERYDEWADGSMINNELDFNIKNLISNHKKIKNEV
jgi:hypothetical protein